MTSKQSVTMHPKRQNHSRPKRNSFLLVIALLGVIFAIILFAHLAKSLLSEKDIAKLIPEEKTIAFLEMKDGLLPSRFENEFFSAENMGQLTQTMLGFNLNELSANWPRKRFGLIMMEEKGNPELVFFFDTGGQRSTVKKLEEMNLIEKGEKDQLVFSDAQKAGRYFGLLENYLVTSTSQDAITSLIDFSGTTLSEGSEYQKTTSHLPRLYWAKAYMNPKKWQQKDGSASLVMQPLNFAMNHVALTVKKQSDGFRFNALAHLNKDLLGANAVNELESGIFTYELTQFLDGEKTGFYTGGENLSGNWQNTLESMANLNPSYSILLESLVRAQLANLFGESVSLRNDLYPLLEGEYAFSVGQSENGQTNYQLILSHNDKAFSQIKLEKMIEGFKLTSGRFSPELRVVELPDGTESRELVANETLQEVEVDNYEDQDIHCLESPTSDKNFCYTIAENWLAMSNHKESIFDAINLNLSSTGSLYSSQTFRRNLTNLSKVTNELSFIQLDPLIKSLESNPYVTLAKPFLSSLDSATWAKQSFDDGMSWEGFLMLK